MICFIGSSHAPQILDKAARLKGLEVIDDPSEAHLIFVSQDTPTAIDGARDLSGIRLLAKQAYENYSAVIVLTSQVPPGFTRSLGFPIFHMAETLRIKDALLRAVFPEQFIIGCATPEDMLPDAFAEYLNAHDCPVWQMTYEEAEFAKIAINSFLVSQVETTNKLAAAAKKLGAEWLPIARVLQTDRRIGLHAYLEPGRWQDSKHLMRDFVTLAGL